MESINLSELSPNCYIITGNKNELACADMLLYQIYNKKRYSKKNIAIIEDKNYNIVIDVKKDDIIETLVCDKCGLDVGINAERCPECEPIDNEDMYDNFLYYKYYIKK